MVPEPATLDPQKVEGTPNPTYCVTCSKVSSPPALGETLPGVAESWETKDNKHYVFHLRKDAKWSNGDPVTAHDFCLCLPARGGSQDGLSLLLVHGDPDHHQCLRHHRGQEAGRHPWA